MFAVGPLAPSRLSCTVGGDIPAETSVGQAYVAIQSGPVRVFLNSESRVGIYSPFHYGIGLLHSTDLVRVLT